MTDGSAAAIGDAPPVETFELDDLSGEIVRRVRPRDLEDAVRQLVDPGAADSTVHWGRNYLYRTELAAPDGDVTVVVKQFRTLSQRERRRRRRGDGKAERSWRRARQLQAAGIPTAEPLALIASRDCDGPSFFVTRHLEGVIEARYLLRAVAAGGLAEVFPGYDFERFVDSVGEAARRLHEAGFVHRDLSIGNVLVPATAAPATAGEVVLVDLNRMRQVERPGLLARCRDLCRLPLRRSADRHRLLAAYWREDRVSRWRRLVYAACYHGFHGRIALKKAWRAPFRWLGERLRPRRAHAHIPAAPRGASARDKIVWDHLSDQPHQHAGRHEKLAVRLADAPSHLRQTLAAASALPRILRRYRELRRGLYQEPVPWTGAGVCVRPLAENPEALLAAIEALGVHDVLLRLHPWSERHNDEEALAGELHRRGFRLSFSLPQNRDLVREPELWRARLEELAERFTPFGRHFQVGQAINRSKWGVWSCREYLALARIADEVLRRHPGVELLGPAVIDFEYHVTAGVLNLPQARFDAAASLLYVDRRGAPENRQLGLDTVDKVVLLQAIADTARGCGPRSWITEVNWPLWEGPHSPAGKSVSVDEAEQANYLARYYLLALTTGCVERVFWWQLIARGYGLIDPVDLRRRPSFAALANLQRQLVGSRFVERLESPPESRALLFERSDGGRLAVAWSTDREIRRLRLPAAPKSCLEQDGTPAPAPSSSEVEIRPAVRFFAI